MVEMEEKRFLFRPLMRHNGEQNVGDWKPLARFCCMITSAHNSLGRTKKGTFALRNSRALLPHSRRSYQLNNNRAGESGNFLLRHAIISFRPNELCRTAGKWTKVFAKRASSVVIYSATVARKLLTILTFRSFKTNTLGRSLKYLHGSFKDKEVKRFIETASWMIEFRLVDECWDGILSESAKLIRVAYHQLTKQFCIVKNISVRRN